LGDERKRLNGLMLMAVEKNVVKDLVLQMSAHAFVVKPRKLKLSSRQE